MRAVLDEKAIAALERHRVSFTIKGRRRLVPGDRIEFEADGTVEPYVGLFAGAAVPTIGSFSYSHSALPPGMSIGRYCSISENVRVMGLNHPTEYVSTSSFTFDQVSAMFRQCLEDFGVEGFEKRRPQAWRRERKQPPVVGNDVWIGQDVLLARGITLGDGCVVAAGAVVTRSVAAWSIVGGNPARVIRMRFDEPTIRRLERLRWWSYCFVDFAGMPYHQPDRFLDALERRVEAGDIVAFTPARLRLSELFEPASST